MVEAVSWLYSTKHRSLLWAKDCRVVTMNYLFNEDFNGVFSDDVDDRYFRYV